METETEICIMVLTWAYIVVLAKPVSHPSYLSPYSLLRAIFAYDKLLLNLHLEGTEAAYPKINIIELELPRVFSRNYIVTETSLAFIPSLTISRALYASFGLTPPR